MNIRRFVNRRSLSRIVGPKLANHIADRFARPGGIPPIDVIDHYAFVGGGAIGSQLTTETMPERNTINWFVPPIGRGSGGHLNIFRFVRNLEQLGFQCRIIVCDQHNTVPPAEIKKQIDEWFFPVRASVHVHPVSEIPPAYTSVATGWQTAYPVRDFRSTVNRAYFVQDFEPFFYPVGSEYILAEETYRFGFAGITAGGWLKDKLAGEYGMRTEAFGFSYDMELYRPLPRRPTETRNIFVYVRPVTPRRGFELSILALERVTRTLPGLAVIFGGWDVANYKVPFTRHNGGSIPISELPDLYSQSDVALVVSLTNLSLLPLELMACGCPVISNKGANVEWLLSDTNAELAEPTPEGLADGLLNVLTNEDRSRQLRENGLAAAKSTSWMDEARKVAQFIQDLSV